MRPLAFSCKAAKASNGRVRWHRCGDSVAYYTNHYQGPPASTFRSHLRKSASTSSKTKHPPNFSFLSTLSFVYISQYSQDTVYFAYSYPYTYTMMRNHVTALTAEHPNTVKTSTLCMSVLGNELPLLSISDFASSSPKQYAVVSGRVHPGETPASWMMLGLIDFLVSAHPIAVQLRRRFVFKVIPMLNPDGVINGNLRCNMNGFDMNRCWSHPVPNLTPPVYCAKKLLKMCQQTNTPHNPVRIFCDFHAHRCSKRIFFFHFFQLLCVFPNIVVDQRIFLYMDAIILWVLRSGCFPYFYLNAVHNLYSQIVVSIIQQR